MQCQQSKEMSSGVVQPEAVLFTQSQTMKESFLLKSVPVNYSSVDLMCPFDCTTSAQIMNINKCVFCIVPSVK
jgi:hypothetical protein